MRPDSKGGGQVSRDFHEHGKLAKYLDRAPVPKPLKRGLYAMQFKVCERGARYTGNQGFGCLTQGATTLVFGDGCDLSIF